MVSVRTMVKRTKQGGAARRKRRPPDMPPQLQALEPRLLLSTTYTVTDLGDAVVADEFLTLREAVLAANGDPAADTIEFATGPGTINLTGGYLEITEDLIITGPPSDRVVVNNTDGLDSVFRIASGTVTIENLTVTGGSDSGIHNQAGDLTLSGVTVTGNESGSWGGGLQNWGTATITNSTISGNTSEGFGGGVANLGTLTAINVTVMNNLADSNDDMVGDGGGIFTIGSTVLHNTVVAGNFLGSGAMPDDVSGDFAPSSSYNLIGMIDGSSGLDDVFSQWGTAGSVLDAKLGSLADNGGPTLTHLPLSGSSVFDTGDNAIVSGAGLTTDQRGAGYPRIVSGTVDLGAVEHLNPNLLVVDTLVDEDDGIYAPGDLALREALARAASLPGPDVIQFDASLNGGTIVLGGSHLEIDSEVTIQGPGSTELTIDGDQASRIFYLADGANLTVDISGLRLTGGSSSGNGGGLYVGTSNTVTVSDTTFDGITASGHGGAVYTNGPLLTLTDCTFTNNTATASWGGAVYALGNLHVGGCTFDGNQASRGGGIYAANSSTDVTIIDSVFTSNGATYGAAVYASGSAEIAIQDSVFTGNITSSYGGAMAVMSGSTLMLTRSTVSGNEAGTAGGGLNVDAAAVTIMDSTISGNQAGSGGGGVGPL